MTWLTYLTARTNCAAFPARWAITPTRPITYRDPVNLVLVVVTVTPKVSRLINAPALALPVAMGRLVRPAISARVIAPRVVSLRLDRGNHPLVLCVRLGDTGVIRVKPVTNAKDLALREDTETRKV